MFFSTHTFEYIPFCFLSYLFPSPHPGPIIFFFYYNSSSDFLICGQETFEYFFSPLRALYLLLCLIETWYFFHNNAPHVVFTSGDCSFFFSLLEVMKINLLRFVLLYSTPDHLSQTRLEQLTLIWSKASLISTYFHLNQQTLKPSFLIFWRLST